MKIRSFVQKGMRTVVQSALNKEANSSPCNTFWNYQPRRPETPMPQPQNKK